MDGTRKRGENLPTYPCKWQLATTARAPILRFDKSNINRRGFYIISFGFFVRPQVGRAEILKLHDPGKIVIGGRWTGEGPKGGGGMVKRTFLFHNQRSSIVSLSHLPTLVRLDIGTWTAHTPLCRLARGRCSRAVVLFVFDDRFRDTSYVIYFHNNTLTLYV